jgi:xanthine/uracil permease
VLLAHRTKQRLRIAVVACAAYALLAAAVAAVFPREELGFLPSFGWWLCAIPIGLIAYVALELFGTLSLGLPFWQRMPSSARVLLLVALISSIAVGAFFISQFVSHHGSL